MFISFVLKVNMHLIGNGRGIFFQLSDQRESLFVCLDGWKLFQVQQQRSFLPAINLSLSLSLEKLTVVLIDLIYSSPLCINLVVVLFEYYY